MRSIFASGLYEDLMALCASSPDKAFYYVDHVLDGQKFRVFTYRMASYTEFLKPSALNCRGIMFYLDSEDKCLGLAAMTPPKFFNWKENPFTMNLDLYQVKHIMDKMDGSLMTTYSRKPTHTEIALKSKTSLTSVMAIDAMNYLSKPENNDLRDFLIYMYDLGYSVSMEWTSPENRIVVGYQEDRLTILEARSLKDGRELSYYYLNSLSEIFGCQDHLVNIHQFDDPSDFINNVASITDSIEGFVVVMNDGLKMKIKTDQYSSLHHCKDSVTLPRRLYETVVNEGHDDLRGMFASDQAVLDRIDIFEKVVKDAYRQIYTIADKFYEDNKHLDRKEFAIKGQAELPRMFFGIVMNYYTGKPFNVKEFLIKHYKEFGVPDKFEGVDDDSE